MDEVDEEDHMLDLTLKLHDGIVQSDLDDDVVHPDHDDAPHKENQSSLAVTAHATMDVCVLLP